MATTTAQNTKPRKWGLKRGDPVSKDHFSSNIRKNDMLYSRIVIRALEGKNLLASDIETGKSDPQCFCWVGGYDEVPNWDRYAAAGGGGQQHFNDLEVQQGEDGFEDRLDNNAHPANINNNNNGGGLMHNDRVFVSKVCKSTIDPIWNEDIVVPVDISDINKLLGMRCIVCLKDEDDFNGVLSFDDLGLVEIAIKDIIKMGKVIQNAVVLPARFYTLAKCPGMKKVEGTIKLTVSLIIQKEDLVNCGVENAGANSPGGGQITSVEEYLDEMKRLSSPTQGTKLNTTASSMAPAPKPAPSSPARVPTAERKIKNSFKNNNNTNNDILPGVSPEAQEIGRIPNAAASADVNNLASTMDSMMQEIEMLKKKIAENNKAAGLSSRSNSIQSVKKDSKLGDGGIVETSNINQESKQIGVSPEQLQSGEGDVEDNDDDLDIILMQPPQGGDMLVNDNSQVTTGSKYNANANTNASDASASVNASAAVSPGQLNPSVAGQGRVPGNNEFKGDDDIALDSYSMISQNSKASSSKKVSQSNISNNNNNNYSNNSTSNNNEDDKVSINGSAGGGATAVKALREMAKQRDQLQNLLEDLTKATKTSLTALTERLDKMQTSIDAGTLKPPTTTRPPRFNNKNKTTMNSDNSMNSQTLRQFKRDAMKHKHDEDSENEYSNRSNRDHNAELYIKTADGIKTSVIQDTDALETASSMNFGNKNNQSSGLHGSANMAIPGNNSNNSVINWQKITTSLASGDYCSAFSYVASMGELEDLDRLMAATGPVPESLPASVRNRVYENIAIMLNNDINNERCLVWILALLRGVITTSSQNNISAITTLSQHTLRDIHSSLLVLASEPSKKGLLSQLLGNQIGSYLIGNSLTQNGGANEEEEFILN